jgi:group I intron endonuclease
MIVYKITNKINGKIYIGQTTSTIQERWNSHCCHSKHGRNALLGKAIRKYGKENFTIEQIDYAQSIEELNKKEIEHISLSKSTDKNIGYNLMSGGDNSRHSEVTKQKMSKSKLGKPSNRKGTTSSLETRRKQSEALKGIPRPKEVIEKMSKSQKGKFVSEETRRKISEACKGRIPWNKRSQC